jgi:hypothetical protein
MNRGAPARSRRMALASLVACGLVLAEAASIGAQAKDPFARGLWPGGVVAYRFDPRVEGRYRDLVRDAMRVWADGSGAVTFVERPVAALDVAAWWLGLDRSLVIRRDPGLSVFANTTMGSGLRRSLAFNPSKDDPAWWKANLIHELGHVLGLTHEHQRRDRDLFVSIPREFLDTAGERAGDYAIAEEWPFPEGAFPYDYDSIMHYGSNIDSNRMTRVDTGGYVASAKAPSGMDIEKIRLLYPGNR